FILRRLPLSALFPYTTLFRSLHWPPQRAWRLIVPIGILDTMSFLSVAIGYTTDQVSVVSVLASLFSAVTVLLAWIFLREKLQWRDRKSTRLNSSHQIISYAVF